jgi:hypothetical protein
MMVKLGRFESRALHAFRPGFTIACVRNLKGLTSCRIAADGEAQIYGIS